ncbi:MAG: hypothetical protein EBS38_02475 [Actinobacteria bacterium]|nr:hypothetical protein [Actinomycetota bacterium]
MRFYRDLIEAAGLSKLKNELSVAVTIALVITSLALSFVTSVPALAVCIAILLTAAFLEILRVIASSRAAAFERLWPQVFDSFQNASQASISLSEQLEYLATNGPERLRNQFAKLAFEIQQGGEIAPALAKFQSSIGSRQADFLALLIELSSELGSNSMAETWGRAASELRSEQALFGQVMAKQGWVLGSAKISLAAPWLIALVLIQLEQNKQAFASELGAVVLVLGLALSAAAYFFVNKLAKLTMPQRIFYAA